MFEKQGEPFGIGREEEIKLEKKPRGPYEKITEVGNIQI